MKKTFKLLAGIAVLMACAISSPELGAAELVGLGVGEKAPAFALKNQEGNVVELEVLRKNGPVAIVFFRSADW